MLMDYGINRIIDPDLTLGKILTIAQNYDKVEQELIDTIVKKKELEDKLKAIEELLETDFTKEQIKEIILR